MFNKITKLGRAYPPTVNGFFLVFIVDALTRNKVPATRFLSRFDKSATNIKESEIFITIGQVRRMFVFHLGIRWTQMALGTLGIGIFKLVSPVSPVSS